MARTPGFRSGCWRRVCRPPKEVPKPEKRQAIGRNKKKGLQKKNSSEVGAWYSVQVAQTYLLLGRVKDLEKIKTLRTDLCRAEKARKFIVEEGQTASAAWLQK